MTCTNTPFSHDTFLAGSAVRTKVGRTCVPLHRNAMEFYNLREEMDVTISMKEFKVSEEGEN